MKRYVVLSIVACVTYSLVAPILKIAMETIPSTVAVFVSNTVMMVLLIGVLYQREENPLTYLRHPAIRYVLAWGITLAVGLLAYYRALELGPVSVVVPIYGLFIPLSSLIGVSFLGEKLTRRKVASIGFAVLAIVLMSL